MENTAVIKYNDDFLVVQANELIRSKQDDLSLVEARLIRLAISQIVEYDTELRTYSCHISELAQYLGIDKKNMFRDIETIAKSLVKKSIYIKDKNSPPKRNGEYNYQIFNWVDYFSYRDGIVTIRLSDKLKPMLLSLNERFTKYGIKNIIALPTSNAIRLFELLTSYESLANIHIKPFTPTNPYPEVEKADNELIFTVEDLKAYFNCADKYPNNSNFITKVIDYSVNGINAKSPTHKVTYRTAKKGRSIGYVLFKINAWEDSDFQEFIKAEE